MQTVVDGRFRLSVDPSRVASDIGPHGEINFIVLIRSPQGDALVGVIRRLAQPAATVGARRGGASDTDWNSERKGAPELLKATAMMEPTLTAREATGSAATRD